MNQFHVFFQNATKSYRRNCTVVFGDGFPQWLLDKCGSGFLRSYNDDELCARMALDIANWTMGQDI